MLSYAKATSFTSARWFRLRMKKRWAPTSSGLSTNTYSAMANAAATSTARNNEKPTSAMPGQKTAEWAMLSSSMSSTISRSSSMSSEFMFTCTLPPFSSSTSTFTLPS